MSTSNNSAPDLAKQIIEFEVALAQTQEALGMIPSGSSATIAAIREVALDLQDLNRGLAEDGVIVPALLRQLREGLPKEVSAWLHFGVTSQDAIDTAHALLYRNETADLEEDLKATIRILIGLADRHRGIPMAARTRHRSATPISFGFLVCAWLSPLVRTCQRMEPLREEIEQLQLGGSGGVLSAFDQPVELAAGVATRLGLNATRISWHSQRDTAVAFADWLVMLSGCSAKAAEDLLFLSADEVAEVSFRSGGGSSSMPHKSNPVALERIVAGSHLVQADAALVRRGLTGSMQRDGRTWPLEGPALLRMTAECRAILVLMKTALSGMHIHPTAMLQNLNGQRGLLHAERARFLLTSAAGPAAAAAAVQRAMASMDTAEEDFLTILAKDEIVRDQRISPDALFSYERELANADALVSRSVTAAQSLIDDPA